MSKCQRGKYLAGGKCGGSTTTYREDTSETGKAFSSLLAARDRQMNDIWSQTTVQQNPITQSTAIVTQVQKSTAPCKKDDIDLILSGDF